MRSNHDRVIECERCGCEAINRLKYCELCAEIVKRERVSMHNEEMKILVKRARNEVVEIKKLERQIFPELSFDCGNCPEID